MSKLKIELVDEKEKYEKVKLVEPNIIFNRADIKYEGNFELLKIEYNSKIQYVSFHIKPTYCYLCVYMMQIEQKVFNEIVKFIYKTFKTNRFYVVQSLNGNKQLNNTVNWLLNLPDTQEEFDKQFSSRSRYNRRTKRKNLEKDFNCEFKYWKKEDLSEEFFERFLELKRIKFKNAYKNHTPSNMLSPFYSITDAYTISINNKLEAFIIYSIINDKEIYQTNLTNSDKFPKYSLGEMLYYYGIENMIKRKIQKIYLGGGKYDYKLNSKAIKINTFEGYFHYMPAKEKIFSIQTEINNKFEEKYLYLFGLKFLIRKIQQPTDGWLDYYKKIKIEKRIKKLAKQYKNKKILIYGAGLMSKTLFENYDLSNLNIKAICDKCYENKENETFYGYPTIAPNQINIKDYDVILVLILNSHGVINELKYKNNITIHAFIK